jgi:hypothetical protein
VKQKDFVVIIVIVFIAAVASYFASSKLLSNSKTRAVEVKKVEAISTDFVTPDKQYFNGNSVNPTQIITIGDQSQSNQTQE